MEKTTHPESVGDPPRRFESVKEIRVQKYGKPGDWYLKIQVMSEGEAHPLAFRTLRITERNLREEPREVITNTNGLVIIRLQFTDFERHYAIHDLRSGVTKEVWL